MDFTRMREIANNDVDVLIEKGKKYADSWKKRGGIGAFMMLARKTDRMEVAAEDHGYDIFEAIEEDNFQEDGLLDDIADLRRYLFLVETEMRTRKGNKDEMLEQFRRDFDSVDDLNEIHDKEKASHGFAGPGAAGSSVDELNDITDKEALLAKADEAGAETAKVEETASIIGGPQEPLLDISNQPRAVPIYIDFIEIPPDDFNHLHAVKNSWTWTREEKNRSSVINWPSSYKALICPAKAGIKWLYKGKLYTITEDSAPIIMDGRWVWEVLAFPDEETNTLEVATPHLKNKADDPGI